MKFFFLSFLLLSCSTMRLRVESDYQGASGKGKVVTHKSYDLASWPWICGVTAIFYGGGCWAYLMLPMVPQEQKAIEDSRLILSQKISDKDVTLLNPVVTRESWSEGIDIVELKDVPTTITQ